MSNLLFNIRFGTYHLTLTRNWKLSYSQNQAQVNWKRNEPETWSRFAIYAAFGKHF